MNAATSLAANAATIAGGKAAENMAKAQQAMQAAQMINGFAGGSNSSHASTASATNGYPTPVQQTSATPSSSLLPVKVACEININNNIISPVLSLQLSQVLGNHNKLVLRFHHDLIQEFGALLLEEKAQSLLGNVVEVILKDINNPDGDKLEDTFVITSVELAEEALAEGIITLICHSPSWVLDSSPHYQGFYQKSLKKIAETICKPLANVKGKLLADPGFTDTVVYACCFNESHWNFLKRIAAETGQWLYSNGKGLIFGKPQKGAAFKLLYGQNCYQVSMGVKAAPVQSGIFDYEAAAHNPMKQAANDYTGNLGSYATKAYTASKSLFTAVAHTGSSSLAPDKSLLEAMGKAKSAGLAATLYTMKGSSTVYGLSVGALVDVEFKRMGQSASHSQVRITSVQHYYTAGGKYENSFEAILATADFPPPIAFTKPQTHPMLAQVTDNKDPKNQGRVKVKFLGWVQEDEQTTDWIRALTPDAGGGGDKVAKNRGLVTIPEVGDQVMIDFELNNPERPFITGSVFHGQHGTGGGEANKIKSLTTRSGNTIRLDDATGSLHASDSKGNNMNMDGAGNITIDSTASIKLTCGAGSLEIKSDGTITINGKDITLHGTGKLDANSNGNASLKSIAAGVTLEAAQILSAEGKVSASYKGGQVDVTASGNTIIHGKQVRVNCKD